MAKSATKTTAPKDLDRLELFRNLLPEAQLLVEYLSFLYRPMSKKLIFQRFDTYRSQEGHYCANMEWWFKKLKDLGLIETTGTRCHLAWDLQEDIATHAALHGRAPAMCASAKRQHNLREPQLNLACQARWALYTQDKKRFADICWANERGISYSYGADDRYLNIYGLLAQGISTSAPLEFYDRQTSTEVAEFALRESIEKAVPVKNFVTWLEKNTAEHSLLLTHKLLGQTKFVEDRFFQCFSAILQGDSSQSAVVESWLKEQSFKKFPHPVLEFLYVAACYAQESPEKARECLQNGDEQITKLMHWLCAFRSGKCSELTQSLKQDFARSDYPPLMHFFRACVLLWCGLEGELESEQLLQIAETYQESGLVFFTEELRALAHHLQGEAKALTPFLRMVKPVHLWDAKLNQLESWAQSQSTSSKPETEAGERIAWILDPEASYLQVSAKIQKRSKNGNWSSGKKIHTFELPYLAPHALTAEDTKILSALSLDQRYGSRSIYRAHLLQAFIGHPRVFLPKGETLELSEGTPSLLVSEQEGFLHLQIVPELKEHSNLGLLRLSHNRYHICPFDQNALDLVTALPPGGLKIPSNSTERIQDLLAVVSEAGILVQSAVASSTQVEKVPADEQFKIRLYPQGSGLWGEVVVEPAGTSGPNYDPGRGPRHLYAKREGVSVEVERDLEREKERFAQLCRAIPEIDNTRFTLDSPTECLEFLGNLQEMPAEDVLVLWPQGKKFQLTGTVCWEDLKLRVSRQNDWFAVQGELPFSGKQQLQLAQLLELHRQQKTRFIALDENRFVALSETFQQKIKALEQASHKTRGATYLLSPLAGSLLLADDELESEDLSWQKNLERIEAAKKLKARLPSKLKATLRPYQKEGFQWLCQSAEWGVGVCLADDMGLGKTVQLLALLLRRAKGGPALVVAPTSVCANWRDEAHTFAPSLNPIIFAENDRGQTLKKAKGGDVIICSYGLLCTSLDLLREVSWHSLILDESQAIKNSSTQRFKAAVSLKADFRVAATGTPVENHLGELWSLFRFLNPGLLGTQKSFLSRYGEDQEALENLKNLITPFILRRLKKDVLKDLPSKTDITMKVEMSPEEKLYYESLRLSAMERIEREKSGLIGILAELSRLRRACCHPRLVDPQTPLSSSKMKQCLRLLDNLKESGHRALVFSQFVDHLSLLREELDRLGFSYQYLDGSTSAKKRAKAVKDFQEGQGDLFLISLKAGGTGLNLTAANYVIHLDPWWNPATEDQASDRAHRLGQQQAVTVYRLIGKDTIEEKILALHEEKRELVDNLLADAGKAGKLSAEELMHLLQESVG